jgi:hypothetical protein
MWQELAVLALVVGALLWLGRSARLLRTDRSSAAPTACPGCGNCGGRDDKGCA